MSERKKFFVEEEEVLVFSLFLINSCLSQESNGLVVTLGIAAATGLGALAFSEVDINELLPFSQYALIHYRMTLLTYFPHRYSICR